MAKAVVNQVLVFWENQEFHSIDLYKAIIWLVLDVFSELEEHKRYLRE